MHLRNGLYKHEAILTHAHNYAILAKAWIQAKFFLKYVIKANKNKHKENKLKPTSNHLGQTSPAKIHNQREFIIIMVLIWVPIQQILRRHDRPRDSSIHTV